MTFSKEKLLILMVCFSMALPFKIISLILIPVVSFFILNVSSASGKQGIIFAFFLFFNLIMTTLLNGPKFSLNLLLSLVFLSPLFIFSMVRAKKRFKIENIRSAINIFICIQVLFCALQALFRILNGWSLDANFGDVISGTFRLPFTYKPDSSNVMFAFMMSLLLAVYIDVFGFFKNKVVIFCSIIFLIMASVNHIYLSVILALLISVFLENPQKAGKYFITSICIILPSIYFYGIMQPNNLNLIVKRFDLIFFALTNFEFSFLGLKGEFFERFLMDINENLGAFFLHGFGGGAYSSRAALFFTGEYINSFTYTNMSTMTVNNTYSLWKELLAAPPWLSGSFNFPYFGIASFLAEYGFLFTITFFHAFRKSLNKLDGISKFTKNFIFFHVIFASLVDNYLEYFQVYFILFFLLILLPRQTILEKYIEKK